MYGERGRVFAVRSFEFKGCSWAGVYGASEGHLAVEEACSIVRVGLVVEKDLEGAGDVGAISGEDCGVDCWCFR